MKKLAFLLSALTAAPLMANVPFKAPLGAETTITFASNGGIRNYHPGEPGIVYLQDRRLRWYRVRLSGDCLQSRTGLDTLAFETDVTGTFDRFSTIRSSRFPAQVCGVTSIRSSLPPAGQPGAPKAASHRR